MCKRPDFYLAPRNPQPYKSTRTPSQSAEATLSPGLAHPAPSRRGPRPARTPTPRPHAQAHGPSPRPRPGRAPGPRPPTGARAHHPLPLARHARPLRVPGLLVRPPAPVCITHLPLARRMPVRVTLPAVFVLCTRRSPTLTTWRATRQFPSGVRTGHPAGIHACSVCLVSSPSTDRPLASDVRSPRDPNRARAAALPPAGVGAQHNGDLGSLSRHLLYVFLNAAMGPHTG